MHQRSAICTIYSQCKICKCLFLRKCLAHIQSVSHHSRAILRIPIRVKVLPLTIHYFVSTNRPHSTTLTSTSSPPTRLSSNFFFILFFHSAKFTCINISNVYNYYFYYYYHHDRSVYYEIYFTHSLANELYLM